MKKQFAILISITFAVVLCAYASSIIPYDNSKSPDLSLPAAYDIAIKALDSSTNQFHCVGAIVYKDAVVSPQGGWLFTFCSTNRPPVSKYVTVEFNGKFHVEDTLFRDE